jgi:hypothetical protein
MPTPREEMRIVAKRLEPLNEPFPSVNFMVYIIIVLSALLISCSPKSAQVPQKLYSEDYTNAIERLNQATTEEQRFHALDKAAKESFNADKIDDARKYANELMILALKYKNNWNYGNAIQDANIVLGRIALRNGDIDEAKGRLLQAGMSPGSPVMDSFGPNISLANDLLQNGDTETVLKYLELCRKFWGPDDNHGKLDRWETEIRKGEHPDFGANLVY